MESLIIIVAAVLIIVSFSIISALQKYIHIKKMVSSGDSEHSRQSPGESKRQRYFKPELQLSYVHEPESNTGLIGLSHTTKGKDAEIYTSKLLSTLGHNYIIFNNLIFDKLGVIKTTEVDHLVISPYGIFCVETKSHAGSVYGGARNREWKQYLRGEAYPFYNPLFQNGNHAKALKQLLGTRLKSKIHYFVIFPKADKVRVNSALVISRGSDLIEIISSHRVPIYSNQELSEIAYLLASYTKRYQQLKTEHIENVREYVKRLS